MMVEFRVVNGRAKVLGFHRETCFPEEISISMVILIRNPPCSKFDENKGGFLINFTKKHQKFSGCQKSMIWEGFERRRPKISPLRGALRVSLHFYALLRSFWALKLVQNKQNLKEKNLKSQNFLVSRSDENKGGFSY